MQMGENHWGVAAVAVVWAVLVAIVSKNALQQRELIKK